ncbi:MAG TPA: hypothetical protein PKD78_11545, partial [Saprospiraceae bacterium]|nr:hypothetical protein [Saprospiraceae bacterium]
IKPNPNGGWLIAGEPLDDNKTYWITLPEFLLSGNEQNMAFLKAAPSADGSGTTNPDILKINKPDPKNKSDLRNDIRLLLIKSLRGK